jgi:tetratricopeptide (TPR) repeat protein
VNQTGRAATRGGIVGRYEAIDSLAREMRRAVTNPTAADRSTIDYLERHAAADFDGALDAAVRLSERIPAANYTVGFLGVLTNRPRLAMWGLERLDPDVGWTRESANYWVQLAAALHQLGRYAEELRVAQKSRDRFPRALTLLNAELRARIGLGDVGALSRQDLQPIAVLRLALELKAHGHAQQSRLWLTALVDSAPKGDIPFPDRIWVTMALLALDRLDEATAMLEKSIQLDTLALDQRGMLGTAYARQGRRADALRISEQLASVKEPYLLGLPTLWRAKIAARLGDRDAAVDLLARAFREGAIYHPNFPSQRGTVWHSDPDFESLRGFSRYEDLTRPR